MFKSVISNSRPNLNEDKEDTMFKNRREAGQILAQELRIRIQENGNCVLVAISNGGLVVANEIAKELTLPVDLFCIKKIYPPRNLKKAIGAVTETGHAYYNKDLITHFGVNDLQLRRLTNEKKKEAKKEADNLRKGQQSIPLSGLDILIIDDGVDTGTTIKAAIKLINLQVPNKIQVATPICTRESWNEISNLVDNIYVLETPNDFLSISDSYLDFTNVSNQEVMEILESINGKRNEEDSTPYQSQNFTMGKKHYHIK